MKYCVTLQLRELQHRNSIPILSSSYYECDNIRDLNDWLFHHICNSCDSKEIINIYFEVVE